jgi:hypothetical protein
VYAYYDTYSNQYVVLESNGSGGGTEMAFGYIIGTKQMSVQGYSGGNLSVGDIIGFENPLNWPINYDCSSFIPCVIAKFNIC